MTSALGLIALALALPTPGEDTVEYSHQRFTHQVGELKEGGAQILRFNAFTGGIAEFMYERRMQDVEAIRQNGVGKDMILFRDVKVGRHFTCGRTTVQKPEQTRLLYRCEMDFSTHGDGQMADAQFPLSHFRVYQRHIKAADMRNSTGEAALPLPPAGDDSGRRELILTGESADELFRGMHAVEAFQEERATQDGGRHLVRVKKDRYLRCETSEAEVPGATVCTVVLAPLQDGSLELIEDRPLR